MTSYGMRIMCWSSDVCSSDLARQDRTHLHEHARVRIVAVGNLRHRKPAQQADRPGGRECGPATLPDRMQRDAQFVVESVHARTFQNMLSGMMITRSEERSEGKGCGGTGRSCGWTIQ